MLRLFVLTLVLLNGTYFAWSQGLLLGLGFAPAQQTEPQRLGQQIKPDALRLIAPQELQRDEPAPLLTARPRLCLQAGLFDATQSEPLRRALASDFPAGSWTLEAALEPARWIVYMGKFANAEALAKKRSELASLNLKFEPLNNAMLQLGLSLGGFDTQAGADAELAVLSRRGVRTARVVQERAELRGLRLRLAEVDEALRARLDALKPLLAGKTLLACQ